MNKLFFILLVVLFTFPQDNFAQKKFIADELSVTEGLKGEKIKTHLIIKITPYRVTVTDNQGIMNEYVSVSGYFGFGKRVKAVDTYTNMICYVYMYKNTINVTFEGSRQVLWFKGTFYY